MARSSNYKDWQYEVANGDTVLGYRDWQEHKDERDRHADECYPAKDSHAMDCAYRLAPAAQCDCRMSDEKYRDSVLGKGA